MSQQLQALRAAAALRRQQSQQEQIRAPLRSPTGSEFDASSVASLRSAASSRRSHMSRTSTLLGMASAKSEAYVSTESVNGGTLDEEFENENPNAFGDAKSEKSACREEENLQQEQPRKEKPFSEKCSDFRCKISGNWRI